MELDSMMPEKLREKLQKQGYHLLGVHGAFKACQWQHKSLREGKYCYKQRFYGIESHRCLQMTPLVDKCTQQCRFCWRITPSDIGEGWDQVKVDSGSLLSPRELLDQTLMANLRSLGGYNPDVETNVPRTKYEEARQPKHVAISLSGEPTLYPFLSELIEEIDMRDMTSFLVTNGTMPKVLSELTMPTQLYITLAAPNEGVHNHLCAPVITHAWNRLIESQELLKSLSCRTVNRLTLVEKKNMIMPDAYANLILKGEPDFIEVKGYMYLGSSKNRLKSNHAPSHRSIRAFAEKIASLTGYYIADEQIESRVVLLTRQKQIKKLP